MSNKHAHRVLNQHDFGVIGGLLQAFEHGVLTFFAAFDDFYGRFDVALDKSPLAFSLIFQADDEHDLLDTSARIEHLERMPQNRDSVYTQELFREFLRSHA